MGRPPSRWLAANRPEATYLAWYKVNGSCHEPTSVEEIEEVWRLVAQYAQEWAAYLEVNGCTYLDDC